ncbi:MAG TPA: DUF1501 domain-containing protein [Planctomycetia bacterium]|nr:DUF1501 domain-containing protein [Planctomycetia bacterium]
MNRRILSRRDLLLEGGMGFAGLAAGALLAQDGVLRAGSEGVAASPLVAKAKRVIWLFMVGGVSQMESFDPKPALVKYSGKTIDETPFKEVLKSPYLKNKREFVEGLHKVWPKVYPLQIGWRKRGKAGVEISDWWPHLGECSEHMAFVRSMYTTDNDHGAQLQFHTGKHALEGQHPTIGSWIHYGMGALSEDLPQFVVLGTPLADCCGGIGGHGANYLGPEHAGVRLEVDPNQPLPFAKPAHGTPADEQAREFELLAKLHDSAASENPADAALRARIKSYELAFKMQRSVPDAMRLETETKDVQKLYGLDEATTQPFARLCLAARRLAERGVRFIQLFHGSNGGAGAWDAHGGLKANHSSLSAQVDKPIAGLLKDLKRRGMLDDTLVVWATEFGRTPASQTENPYG